jgi:hypothetical protein
MPELSILDARLAEIDRRLRMIQSGLQPAAEPSDDPVGEPPPAMTDSSTPPSPPPPVSDVLEPPPPPSLIARRLAPPPRRPAEDRKARSVGDRDNEIAVLTARLGELTAAHERLLVTTHDLLIEQADMLARATPAVSVAAGPFTDTPALQAFQRALTGLPYVREVTVREYVGSESVVLDVRLGPHIS